MPTAALRSLCLSAVLLAAPGAFAAGGAVTANTLVQRLGDESFSERERAAADLLTRGRDAVAALEEGLKSPDAEVRRRCGELLPLARRSDLEIRVDEFVARGGDAAPLPGWARFRKLAGDDRPARLLFVLIGRSNHALLEKLEKDPALVAAQFGERGQRVGPRVAWVGGAAPAPGGEAESAALLLAAACSTEKNTAAAHQFFNCLYQPAVQTLVRDSAAARRLVTPFLARQLDEPWRLHQTVWLAQHLGLDEFLEGTLKPEVRRQAVAAANRAEDPGTLYQIASVATNLGLRDTVETTLKPAACRLAEKSAAKPEDLSRVQMTLHLLQILDMRDLIESTLKPAACRSIAALADKPYDQYRFHVALNLAKSLDLKDSLEQVLKPAATKALVAMSRQIANDPNKMYVALNLAQTFELKDASEKHLKPAAREFAKAAAKAGDPAKLTQAAHLVTTLDVKDVAEQTLRPAVRKLAGEESKDPARLSQVVQLAQNLGMSDTINDVLKPRARAVLQAAAAGPADRTNVQNTLQMARTLGLTKEAVPLALKIAQAKYVNTWSRGNAVLFVGEYGGKEHVANLEPLLAEKTLIGSTGFNSTTIRTELRDVALAASVALSGQSLDYYDFPYLKLFGVAVRPMGSQPIHSFGFSDSASRDAALKKWKERAAARAGAAPPAAPAAAQNR